MNTLEALATAPAVEALGRVLLHFLWQGAALGLIAALALAGLRQCGPRSRYALAGGVMLLMCAAPVATWVRVYDGGTKAAVSTTTAAPVRMRAEPAAAEPGAAPVPNTFVAHIDVLAASAEDARSPWLLWLVAGWLCGVAALGARALGGWFGLARLRRTGHRPLSAAWQDKLTALAHRLGITRSLRAVESKLVSVPAVLGWWRPLILVPCSALTRLTPDQLEAVLAHELAHIRRHDYLVNLVQSAVETLLFYHPAVWWLSRRMREERELCCDDVAASSCGDPIGYARALAELEGCRHPAPLALAATGSTGDLMARVRRLAGLPVLRRGGRSSWTAPPVLGLALVLGLVDRGLSPGAPSGVPEAPVVAVSTDGKLIQIPKGLPVVVRDARGDRIREGGLLLVVTPDQRLTIDGVTAPPGTHLPRDRQLVLSDARGRALWSFSRLRRGDRDFVELVHHSAISPPPPSPSVPSSPTASRKREP